MFESERLGECGRGQRFHCFAPVAAFCIYRAILRSRREENLKPGSRRYPAGGLHLRADPKQGRQLPVAKRLEQDRRFTTKGVSRLSTGIFILHSWYTPAGDQPEARNFTMRCGSSFLKTR